MMEAGERKEEERQGGQEGGRKKEASCCLSAFSIIEPVWKQASPKAKQ